MKALKTTIWVYVAGAFVSLAVGNFHAAGLLLFLFTVLHMGSLLIDYYFDKKSKSEKEPANDQPS